LSLQERATDFQIETWLRVDPTNLDQIKAELYQKNPVVLSLHDSTNFQYLRPGQIYSEAGRYVGWHAITAVGYDERRQAFKVINSWGTKWAENGFGWIGYGAFRSDVQEAYVMRVKAAPSPPPKPPEPQPPIPTPSPPVSVIPPIDCGEVKLKEGASKRELVGFVGHEEDLEKIRQTANGAEINVQLRPWPQCEALLTLNKQLAKSDSPNVSIRAPSEKILKSGERLVFEIKTPPYPSYLHVAYFQADGTVVNLVQPGVGSFKAYSPGSKIVIGDEPGGSRFRVTEPFGREMLVVLAARSPIFPDARPTNETHREFLTALRRVLLMTADTDTLAREIVAGYDAIITKEASQ